MTWRRATVTLGGRYHRHSMFGAAAAPPEVGVQLFGTIDNLGDSRDRKLAFATPAFERPGYGRMYRLGMRWNFQRKE